MYEKAEAIPQQDEIHHGYRISPVWHYRNMKGEYMHSDFNVSHEDKEVGWMEHCKTLAEVKAYIDEIIEQ